ncbi:MAG TPA: hypothetical protein VGX95_08310 [Xanthobacteraceae bacterium]|nr:hypothetical protein [Xanthobacteraceae bacterium]
MANHITRVLISGSICFASAIAVAPNGNAADKFDGRWSALLTTRSGPCQPSYRGDVQIINGIVQALGGPGGLSGRVSANGHVVVTGSLGPISGVANGRLSGNSGSGTWRAHVQEGPCAGTWTAHRE